MSHQKQFFALLAVFFLHGSITLAEEPAPPPANSDASASSAAAKPAAELSPANPHSRKVPNITTRPAWLAIVPEPGGRKTLTIHYQWPIHEKTSIELRLVPTADKEKADKEKVKADKAQKKVDEEKLKQEKAAEKK